MDSFRDTHRDSIEVKAVISDLSKDRELVAIPTDKTNSFLTMKLQDYVTDMHSHLTVRAQALSFAQLEQLHTDSLAFLATQESHLSKKEHAYLLECVNSRAVPTPHLLIKDHKPVSTTTGRHSTRLIIPASNFTAGFPKLGYLAIKPCV